MKDIAGLQTASSVIDSAQLPASVAPPEVKAKQPPRFRDSEHWVQGVATAAPREVMLPERPIEMPKEASLDLEEFFEGIIEEITDDAVEIRTTSSTGEGGVAWLDVARIPEGERKYLELGAPMRVSILMRRDGTNRREHQIRVLRPSQWRPPQPREEMVAYMLEQMKAVLR